LASDLVIYDIGHGWLSFFLPHFLRLDFTSALSFSLSCILFEIKISSERGTLFSAFDAVVLLSG
jgi:hypothetical protein